MRNPHKHQPDIVAVMDQIPDEDDCLKTELVCENGIWFIRALEPVEPMSVEQIRDQIEAMREKRC